MLSKPFHPPAKKRLLLYDVIDEGEIESRSAKRSTVAAAATQFSIRDVVEGESETDEDNSASENEDTKAARKYLQNIKPGQFDFTITPKASGGLGSVTVVARTERDDKVPRRPIQQSTKPGQFNIRPVTLSQLRARAPAAHTSKLQRNASDWDDDSESPSLVASSDSDSDTPRPARNGRRNVLPSKDAVAKGKQTETNKDVAAKSKRTAPDELPDLSDSSEEEETPEVREARKFLRNVKPGDFNFNSRNTKDSSAACDDEDPPPDGTDEDSDQLRDKRYVQRGCCSWAHEAHEECGPALKDLEDDDFDDDGSEDDDDQDDPGACSDQEEFVMPTFARPTRIRLPKPSSRLLAPGRIDRKEDISTKRWSVVPCGEELPGWCRVTDTKTAYSHCVPRARVKKTMLLLDSDTIADTTNPTKCNCTCKQKCYELMTGKEILSLRKTVAELPNQVAVTNYLMNNIRRDGGLKVKGATACRGYYAKLHEVSQGKIFKANQLAKNGDVAVSGRAQSLVPREAKQTVHAVTFWTIWFDEFCQQPNYEVRLFPVNQTYKEIYKQYFLPWWAHQGHPKSERPAERTWQNARHLPQFEDVQRRAKHFHCRCTVCATLQKQSMAAFANAESLAVWQRDRRLHYAAIVAWRQLESHLNALAIQTPSDMILLSYDDTEFMTFPNMTNRPLKNMGNTGFRAIPWLLTNHGTRKREYVYMPYGKWKKGANRILTQIHATLSAIKGDPTNKQHTARRLVLIADNASENKNKEILAYIADLVLNNWFDSVELIFGEVGHTHNGNDATHKDHNVNVANHEAGDLGHFVSNYQKVWSNPDTRPRASILNTMFNWVEYYKRPESGMRALSGATKTQYDQYAVRAFKASRGPDKKVDLMFKMDPATEKDWRGNDGHYGSAGFCILELGPTRGVPLVKKCQKITCEGMVYAEKILTLGNLLEPFGLAASCKANYDAASTFNVPMTSQVEHVTPVGKWGPLFTTGSSKENQGYVRLLEKVWWPHPETESPTVWALPENTRELATSLKFHFSGDQALIDDRPLSYMRYVGEKVQDAPIYNHPNNEKRREVEPVNLVSRNKSSSKGRWVGEVEATRTWVIDFKHCKVREFAVVHVTNKKTKVNSIELYKIKNKNEDNQTFQGSMYQCSAVQSTDKCLTGIWHALTGKAGKKLETIQNTSVIDYFPKLIGTKSTKLPKGPVNAVKERCIYKDEMSDVEPESGEESESEENEDAIE